MRPLLKAGPASAGAGPPASRWPATPPSIAGHGGRRPRPDAGRAGGHDRHPGQSPVLGRARGGARLNPKPSAHKRLRIELAESKLRNVTAAHPHRRTHFQRELDQARADLATENLEQDRLAVETARSEYVQSNPHYQRAFEHSEATMRLPNTTAKTRKLKPSCATSHLNGQRLRHRSKS